MTAPRLVTMSSWKDPKEGGHSSLLGSIVTLKQQGEGPPAQGGQQILLRNESPYLTDEVTEAQGYDPPQVALNPNPQNCSSRETRYLCTGSAGTSATGVTTGRPHRRISGRSGGSTSEIARNGVGRGARPWMEPQSLLCLLLLALGHVPLSSVPRLPYL